MKTMKKLPLLVGIVVTSLWLPSLAAYGNVGLDNQPLHWDVRESFSDSQSGANIEAKIGGKVTEIICDEFGKRKLATYPVGASCDPSAYSGRVFVGFPSLQVPVCEGAGKNCIEEFFAVDPSGKKLEGQFLGYTTLSGWVPENKQLGNHLGAASGIWKIAGAIHSGGSDFYEVHLTMEGGFVEFRNGRQLGKFKQEDRSFNSAIRPISVAIEDGVYKKAVCGDCSALPAELIFGVTAVLPKSIKSWYSGRIIEPDVIYEPASSGFNRITITGKPMTIPTFQGRISKSQASPELLSLYDWCPTDWHYCPGWHTNGYSYGNDQSSKYLRAWRPLANDSATGQSTTWTIRTVTVFFGRGSGGDLGFSRCAEPNKPAGIVSTNALIYDGMVPQFQNGFFNYRVAGMHYKADGKTEFLGRYEMVMDEQLARCMFRFPKAPISATVTVTGENGENVVATSLVNSSNGKLRLAAYNFTFSEKTIKIKLGAQWHITCTKGKTTRYVKGTRCPAGFKRG
ncbi:MAG: hypothetical protein F2536_01870 [Actinobacteria bacterium]|nr:hypothetical protein [Actinomycetota bacterium]